MSKVFLPILLLISVMVFVTVIADSENNDIDSDESDEYSSSEEACYDRTCDWVNNNNCCEGYRCHELTDDWTDPGVCRPCGSG